MSQHEKKFFSFSGFVSEIHENRVNAAMAFWGGVSLVLAGGIIMMAVAAPLALIGTMVLGTGFGIALYTGLEWLDSKLSDQAEPGI